jgi:hypothetical protein
MIMRLSLTMEGKRTHIVRWRDMVDVHSSPITFTEFFVLRFRV